MADEIKTEQKTDTTTETKTDWREEAGAKAVFAQLSKLQSELESYKSKEAEKARLEQEARIKTDADLQAFKKQMADEIIAEKAKAAGEIRKAKAEALVAGIQDPWKRKGLLAELSSLDNDIDMSAHLEGLKKSDPKLFENLPFSQAASPPQGGRAANSSTENWDKVIADTKSNDWNVAGPAYTKLNRYYNEKGEYPNGYNPKG